MTKAPNNINNLHRIQTFISVQQFVSNSGSFAQLKWLMCLIRAHQTLTSSSALAWDLLWQNSGRFPKKMGLSKVSTKLPLRPTAGQSFLRLVGRGKPYLFHTLAAVTWVARGGCITKASWLSTWDEDSCNAERRTSCPASPEPPESSFSMEESGCAQAPLWDALWGRISHKGRNRGVRDLLWYEVKAKGPREEGCEAHGKFNFFRSCECFQCELHCHHSWSK